MSDLSEAIGARLKVARKSAGFRSASAFAECQSIPISTYSQHETGKRVLSADMLMHYSQLFKVSPGWLLTGEQFSGSSAGIVEDMPVIQGKIALVEMDLFMAVLTRLVPLFSKSNRAIGDKALLDFAIEVYNGIITTSATDDAKLAMINLSVRSLERGAQPQEPQEKVSSTG